MVNLQYLVLGTWQADFLSFTTFASIRLRPTCAWSLSGSSLGQLLSNYTLAYSWKNVKAAICFLIVATQVLPLLAFTLARNCLSIRSFDALSALRADKCAIT